MTDSTGQRVPLTLSGTTCPPPHLQIVTPCFGHWGDGSGFWSTVLVTHYNLEDSLGTAQFQFGDYLYEKYLDLNAWGIDPLSGSRK